MKIKIGINGMGRIGRMIVRSIAESKNKNLEIKHNLPVIEGVSSAVVLAESLVNLKIKNSKVGSYALPRNKEYMGYLNKFKP